MAEHSSGVIVLAHWDCPAALRELVRVFGGGSVFVDLRRHPARGDAERNRLLAAAQAVCAGVCCSNGTLVSRCFQGKAS